MQKNLSIMSLCAKFYKKRSFTAIFAGLIIILALIVVFFCRKPVILVTDNAFNVLYGKKRGLFKQFSLSLSLFRPVKTIAIAEGAGPDLVAQGAAGLSRRPLAAFFPYRYKDGALRYLQIRPGSPVIILAGRKPHKEEGNDSAFWFYTDTVTDLYRAGGIAGLFAGYDRQNRDIALFYKEIDNSEKEAFIEGLEDQKWSGSPLFSPDSAEINLACALILEDFRFSEEEKSRSLILFSWMDPVLAPQRTLAIFDDSPWAQISPALDLIGKGEQSGSIPSGIIVCRGDKTQKSLYNGINRIKNLKKRTENTDN